MMKVANHWAGAAVLLALGCSQGLAPGSQVVEFRTDRGTYTAGDGVRVTLTNRGPATVGPGGAVLCRVQLERREGDAWLHITELGAACVMIGMPPVDVGASVHRSFDAPVFPAPGVYRMSVAIHVTGNGTVTITTNSVTVSD